jgi:N-acetylglucosamine-6-sulfatase
MSLGFGRHLPLKPTVGRALPLLIALATAIAAPAALGGPRASAQERPNVVVIMTDDQTVEQMRVLDITRERIGARGVTFANSFVSWPVCCPSRATFLTGQYAHNHRVRGNRPPHGGFARLRDANTLAVWLRRHGYHTAHVGKYLNGYPGERPLYVPPGWDEWYAATVDDHGVGDQDMYDYVLNQNGSLVAYGSTLSDYKTDVFTNLAVDVISRRARGSRPFFLAVMYNAPHFGTKLVSPQPPHDCQHEAGSDLIPVQPAARHAGAFGDEPLPRPPNFNEADVSDKPEPVRSLPPLTDAQIAEIARSYRCELRALLAVDEGVGRITQALARNGKLDRTLLIFTSDNGFFHGEHRMTHSKLSVYEPSIRVPLLVRGPGIPRGRVVRDLVVNTDLAPTIAALTGAEPGLAVDGRSLRPIARRPKRLRGRAIRLDTNQYDAVRTWRYVYSELASGEREMYDLERDPFQLQSVHDDPAYALARSHLRRLLGRLRRCSGSECWRRPALRLNVFGRAIPGRGCLRPGFRVTVRGGGERKIAAAAFRLSGRRAGEATARPFRQRFAARLLRGRARHRINVSVELHDGRRTTLQRRVSVCR